MKTRSAKAKGRKLQDLVRDLILKHNPSLEQDDVQCAIMGQSGTDIKLSPAAKRVFPYAVECKNQEKISIWASIQQAEENAAEGQTPLLVFKKNRTDPYIAMKLEDFIKLTSNQ